MLTGLKSVLLLVFRFLFKKNRGQISKNTEIGRWIELLSSLTDVQRILEIGTWNGAGSSQLIARGVSSNPLKLVTCEVIGLEVHRELAKIAKKILENFPFLP